MAAYARQAKDTEMIQWATEIKVRAERRAGEMLRQSAESGERAGQSEGGKRAAAERWGSSSQASTSHAPTLDEIGITKDQSSRWQQLASMPDEHFETAVATAKDTAGQVTTAFMLREAEKLKPDQQAQRGVMKCSVFGRPMSWIESRNEMPTSHRSHDTTLAIKAYGNTNPCHMPMNRP